MTAYADTSAIVRAFLADEPEQEEMRRFLFGSPGTALTSDLTRVELVAAFRAAGRAERIGDVERLIARVLTDVSRTGLVRTLTLDLERLELEVRRLLARHHLRAADAIHLATAIVAMEGPEGVRFVTRDRRQSDAARAEGFEVV